MGIIYEILCWTTGLRYIGMTTRSLKKRLREHISRNYYNKYCSSKLVLEHGNFEIYQLEIVEDESLLKEREKYYIQHTDCVNIFTGSVKEYMKEYQKEYQKEYREKKKNLKNSKL